MNHFQVEFSFFNIDPQQGLSRDTQHNIRKMLADALRSCGYRIKERHGEFDWEKDGCSCDADTYNEAERRLYITLIVDFPGVSRASPVFFMTVGLSRYCKQVDDLGNVGWTLAINGKDMATERNIPLNSSCCLL